mmetsp:Transcript_6897/g.12187  ORF Transcript_6897/g.12187 Transcript_6897/m.12187 type:complete len:365 (+) Transcript_6897:158-1252(+)
MEVVLERNDISQVEVVATGQPSLGDDQVLVKVVKNALTSNVVSYATAPSYLRYFDFFPSFGSKVSVPSWGIAEVVESKNKSIKVGERIYGFLPFRQYVVLTASTVKPDMFLDVADQKAELPQIYNSYNRLDAGFDDFYDKKYEDLMILMRPLFFTSWLLRDFAEQELGGPGDVILMSASSKTAYSLAYLLKSSTKGPTNVIGLTSPRNEAFVRGLGVYDTVLVYDEIGDLKPSNKPTMVIDMAGNAPLAERIKSIITQAICVLVGSTHKEEAAKGDKYPGDFFFAPKQGVVVSKRMGGSAFNKQVASDYKQFIQDVEANGWCKIQNRNGPEASAQAFREMLSAKKVEPDQGLVLSMWEDECARL